MHGLEDCSFFFHLRAAMLGGWGWLHSGGSGLGCLGLGSHSSFVAVGCPMIGSPTKQAKVFVRTALPFLRGQLSIFPKLLREVRSWHLLEFWGFAFILQGTGRQVVDVLLLGLWRTFGLVWRRLPVVILLRLVTRRVCSESFACDFCLALPVTHIDSLHEFPARFEAI